MLRSLRYVQGEAGRDLVIDLMSSQPKNELIQSVGRSSLAHGVLVVEPALARLEIVDIKRWQHGRETYRTLCISCHGPDGLGVASGALRLAPPLAKSRWLLQSDEVPVRILLHGLTGAIDGVEYQGNLMAAQAANPDGWIADVLTYARNSFGNEGARCAPSTSRGSARHLPRARARGTLKTSRHCCPSPAISWPSGYSPTAKK